MTKVNRNYANTGELNITLLTKQCITEEIKEGIRHIPELNNNASLTF